MKELIEYRTRMIERLVAAAHEFRAECLAVQDVFTPLETGGWSVHQIAVHTRDVDALVYGLRARRTAIEDNPEFQNFDGEVYMAGHYSKSDPLDEILAGLVENVESLAELLREMPSEVWARVSTHVMLGGGLTMQGWVEKDLAHIEEHLKAIREAEINRFSSP